MLVMGVARGRMGCVLMWGGGGGGAAPYLWELGFTPAHDGFDCDMAGQYF